MVDTLRILVAAGLLLLLFFLRLEAPQFGAAEYDEPGSRRRHALSVRLSWYVLGFGLIAAIYLIHPQPHDVLNLVVGRSGDALVYGLILAVLGVGQALAFAEYRYHDLRLPPSKAYPGAVLNAIGTAFVDEAAFRGVLLGMLVAIGVPGGLAVIVETLLYALATRLGAPGRHPYMLVLALGIGLFGGWATLQTGGIGAAIFGHAVTSFALFVSTGHAGQVPGRGREPEEVERTRRPPEGWRDALPGLRRGSDGRGLTTLGPDRSRRAALAGPAAGSAGWGGVGAGQPAEPQRSAPPPGPLRSGVQPWTSIEPRPANEGRPAGESRPGDAATRPADAHPAESRRAGASGDQRLTPEQRLARERLTPEPPLAPPHWPAGDWGADVSPGNGKPRLDQVRRGASPRGSSPRGGAARSLEPDGAQAGESKRSAPPGREGEPERDGDEPLR